MAALKLPAEADVCVAQTTELEQLDKSDNSRRDMIH